MKNSINHLAKQNKKKTVQTSQSILLYYDDNNNDFQVNVYNHTAASFLLT